MFDDTGNFLLDRLYLGLDIDSAYPLFAMRSFNCIFLLICTSAHFMCFLSSSKQLCEEETGIAIS